MRAHIKAVDVRFHGFLRTNARMRPSRAAKGGRQVMTNTTSGKFASPLLGAGLLLVASPILIYWFKASPAKRLLGGSL